MLELGRHQHTFWAKPILEVAEENLASAQKEHAEEHGPRNHREDT
jgi:hypothetical protein